MIFLNARFGAALVAITAAAQAPAQAVFNFAVNNGGLTPSQTFGATGEGAWTYGTAIASVGGTATWATPGQGTSSLFALTTTALDVLMNGQVTGSFTHRYNFEAGFDGGQIQYSVNGGAFNTVPTSLITGQTYGSPISGFSNPLGPAAAFTGTSPGYATPSYVTSNFTLGAGTAPAYTTGTAATFAAGDMIQFRFLAGYDNSFFGASPDWQIATLNLNNIAVPEPGALALCALAAIGGWRFHLRRRPLRISTMTLTTRGMSVPGGTAE